MSNKVAFHSIKKVIVNEEKEVSFEDVHNKLCGLCAAYSTIISYDGTPNDNIITGLELLAQETLDELKHLIWR